jgi:CRISPR-associated protein Cas2
MKRIRHLVAYDIRDPVRLRRVHKKMKGFGFPMQYSVFLCDLNAAERLRLLQELTEIIDSVDCVAVVELGDPADQRAFTYLGPRPQGFKQENFFV